VKHIRSDTSHELTVKMTTTNPAHQLLLIKNETLKNPKHLKLCSKQIIYEITTCKFIN